MAGSSFFALLDDIASVLDDVAVLSKVAAKKSAGVLGDDLALNAEQVSGVSPDRELPVVYAVAKGSAVNKLILIPAAILISTFLPWAVFPLLLAGGTYLCYEGIEKVLHKFWPHADPEDAAHKLHVAALTQPDIDLVALEKDKIRGAIRTDFILSAEILIIALSTVATAPLLTRVGVLTTIGVLMTVGVYGLVAAIIKLDDLGLYLQRARNALARALGAALLRFAPALMKFLSVAGTAAMFLVGGGILVHGVPLLASISHDWAHAAELWPAIGAVAGMLVPMLFDFIAGMVIGLIAIAFMSLVQRLRPATIAPTH